MTASKMIVRSKVPIKYFTQSGMSGGSVIGGGSASGGGGVGEGIATMLGAGVSGGGGSVVKALTALHSL